MESFEGFLAEVSAQLRHVMDHVDQQAQGLNDIQQSFQRVQQGFNELQHRLEEEDAARDVAAAAADGPGAPEAESETDFDIIHQGN